MTEAEIRAKLAAGTGDITIPPGTYELSKPLRYNLTDATIRGDGGRVIFKRSGTWTANAPADAPVLDLIGFNITLQYISVQGETAGTSLAPGVGIRLGGWRTPDTAGNGNNTNGITFVQSGVSWFQTNVVIGSNTTVPNSPQTSASEINITDECSFSHANVCIDCYNGNSINVWVSNCRFTTMGAVARTSQATNVHFTDCTFTNCAGWGEYGFGSTADTAGAIILANGPGHHTLQNVWAEGCYGPLVRCGYSGEYQIKVTLDNVKSSGADHPTDQALRYAVIAGGNTDISILQCTIRDMKLCRWFTVLDRPYGQFLALNTSIRTGTTPIDIVAGHTNPRQRWENVTTINAADDNPSATISDFPASADLSDYIGNTQFTGTMGVKSAGTPWRVLNNAGEVLASISNALTNYSLFLLGKAGEAVAAIFRRTNTAATIYFGEDSDTGGVAFRGSGGMTITAPAAGGILSQTLQNLASNGTNNTVRYYLSPHNGYDASTSPFIEVYNSGNNAGMRFAVFNGSRIVFFSTDVNGNITCSGTIAASNLSGVNTGDTAFNVRAYGATGDGTTNDRLAVQTAITAAETAGGIVYFPPGTYRMVPSGGVCLTLTAHRVALVGAGAGASTLLKSGDGDTVVNTASTPPVGTDRTGWAICNLAFENDTTSRTGYEVRVPLTRGLTIDTVHFRKVDKCLKLGSPAAATSVGRIVNVFADHYRQFLHLIRYIDLWVANVTTFSEIGHGAITESILLDGGVQSLAIVNSDFIGNGTGAALRIKPTEYVSDTLNDRPSFNKFTNSYFDNHAVGLEAEAGHLNTFTNCWFSNRGVNGGIRLLSSTKGYVFVACEIANNDGGAGYVIDCVGDVEISGGSVVANETTAGIDILSGEGYRVRGVRATNGYSMPGTQNYGIRIASGVDNFIIKDNDLRGNATNGLLNLAGTGATKIVADNLGVSAVASSLTDTFTGSAVNLESHTSDSGHSWTRQLASLNNPRTTALTGSGRIQKTTEGSATSLYLSSWVPTSWGIDLTLAVDQVTADDYAGICFHYAGADTDSANYYYFRRNGAAGDWQFTKITGGSTETLVTNYVAAVTATISIAVRRVGANNEITVTINGTPQTTIVDSSSPLAAGAVGTWLFGGTNPAVGVQLSGITAANA